VSVFTAEENAGLLEDLAGNVVARGSETTQGDFRSVPATVLRGEGTSARVLTATASVRIVNGSLSGIGPKKGIGEAITVDGANYEIVDIQAPEDEPHGAILELFLKKV
jgi:hypothetical protein